MTAEYLAADAQPMHHAAVRVFAGIVVLAAVVPVVDLICYLSRWKPDGTT